MHGAPPAPPAPMPPTPPLPVIVDVVEVAVAPPIPPPLAVVLVEVEVVEVVLVEVAVVSPPALEVLAVVAVLEVESELPQATNAAPKPKVETMKNKLEVRMGIEASSARTSARRLITSMVSPGVCATAVATSHETELRRGRRTLVCGPRRRRTVWFPDRAAPAACSFREAASTGLAAPTIRRPTSAVRSAHSSRGCERHRRARHQKGIR